MNTDFIGVKNGLWPLRFPQRKFGIFLLLLIFHQLEVNLFYFPSGFFCSVLAKCGIKLWKYPLGLSVFSLSNFCLCNLKFSSHYSLKIQLKLIMRGGWAEKVIMSRQKFFRPEFGFPESKKLVPPMRTPLGPIVATFVSACSQGQRTHSARTNIF